MPEECLGTGIHRFAPGDCVAVVSKAACSNIHENGPVKTADKSSYFDKIATVLNVTAIGDVKVSFGRELRGTISPQNLVKIPNLLPGDLVMLVDDIRGEGNLTLEDTGNWKSATQDCGRICLVLQNCVEEEAAVYVTLGREYHKFSPLHLAFVARPSYGDFMARVREYACIDDLSLILAENLFTALQSSMQDLPHIDVLTTNKLTPYVPGSVVKVSNDIKKFIRWQLNESPVETRDPSTKRFQTLQHYAYSYLLGSANSPFPAEQVRSLLEMGKVVHVDCDGNAVVEFNDGRAWCIPSSFLEHVDVSDVHGEGACSPETLSERIDKLISYAHNHGPKTSQTLLHVACFSGNKELVKLMLDGNLGVECQEENGNRPLHYAARGNQPGVMEYLLRKKADINATNGRLHTALHFAVAHGFEKCVRELTKYGRTLNAKIKVTKSGTVHVESLFPCYIVLTTHFYERAIYIARNYAFRFV
ncbi:uncharacterized protein LOC144165143 isoform X1 [Haemaphysalis longicornis]